jgi:Taurine catabolism dioxygenase TauD, TfdA family
LTRIYWGLSRHIGDPVAQNRNGHLLGHVIDVGTSVNDYNKRLTQTSAELQFHSDACDVVGLVCINTAMEGGESALVSATAVHDEMYRGSPRLAHLLYEPITVDRRGEVPAGKHPWMRIPVFNWHKDALIGYAPLKNYVESAMRFEDAPKTGDDQLEAFRLFLDICNDPEFAVRIPFEPGDFQYVHNHLVFHSRTAFRDWPDAPEKRRHLMRIWLSLSDGLELPESIAERWINIQRGTLRGGVNIPNRKDLTIALEPDTPAFD